MAHDLQIANIWKRTSAWLFDSILIGVLTVAIGLALSWVLGYDAHSATVDAAYAKYEAEYSVSFAITQTEYMALSDEDRGRYDAAYEALVTDEEAMHAYNMMFSLTLVIISLGILLAVLIWDFLIPLKLGHGRTLGKKIFGLCLVRSDAVAVNTFQLFTRSILGRFSVETMIPVLMLLMIFWGTIGVVGPLVVMALAIGQALSLTTTRSHCAIHDLMAGTVVVDYNSQTIFGSTEELIEYQKRIAADRAAREDY